jgi:hypothetical protein
MKRILLFLNALIIAYTAFAQRTVQLRNIWTRPQVHVIFEGYTLSFTIKDIDKALVLLSETGDNTYGASCGLDTAGNYIIELLSGTRTEYKNALQPLMQNGVGVFLLMCGHACIETPKHKRLKEIIADRLTLGEGTNETYYYFYDPKTNKRLFSGKMALDMYNKDIGID